MRAMKMYWNNTTLVYKITILFLFPLAVIVCSLVPALQLVKVEVDGFHLTGFLLLVLYILFEVLADGWTFAGIYNKEFRGTEVIKTSRKGMRLYRDMLVVDCLRRYIYFSILSALVMQSASSGLIMGAVATMGIIGSRFFMGYISSMLFAYITPVVTLVLVFIVYEMPTILGWGIALVIALLVMFLAVKLGVYRMERSYYDQTNKNGI